MELTNKETVPPYQLIPSEVIIYVILPYLQYECNNTDI